MQGCGAALVPGVERDQQVDHLGAAELADDEPVGAHAQRLPDELAQPDRAGSLDVRGPGDQPDHVGVVDHQYRCPSTAHVVEKL